MLMSFSGKVNLVNCIFKFWNRYGFKFATYICSKQCNLLKASYFRQRLFVLLRLNNANLKVKQIIRCMRQAQFIFSIWLGRSSHIPTFFWPGPQWRRNRLLGPILPVEIDFDLSRVRKLIFSLLNSNIIKMQITSLKCK